MFTMSYKIKSEGDHPSWNTIQACDNGAKAMQDLIVNTAKILMPLSIPIIWILTRFYKRTILKDEIRYDFYLIPSGPAS